MRKIVVLIAFLVPMIGSAQVREGVDESSSAHVVARLDTMRGSQEATERHARPGQVSANLVEETCTIPSGCAAWPTDPASSTTGGSSSTLCTSDYCLQCALDTTQSRSICYTLFTASGSCKCTESDSVRYDKYGRKWPNCTISGSCAYRR